MKRREVSSALLSILGRRDNESRSERCLGRFLVLAAVLAGVSAVGLATVNPAAYLELIFEDGLVESLSAVFWLCAALAALLGRVGLSERRSGFHGKALVGLFFVCVVCCGEEISWGQRLHGLDCPDWMIGINKQHETNIHNIGITSVYSNLFLLFAMCVFVFFPLWQRLIHDGSGTRRNFSPAISRWPSIIFAISLLVWLLIGFRFGTLGFHPFSLWEYPNQMDDEIFEALLAYCFLSLALLECLRARSLPPR